MDWYEHVFELIDMRSFSNLWFWIVLAVLWSSTSHWVLGVPWDLAQRARRSGDSAGAQDFHDLVRINTNRILFIMDETGLLLSGFLCFVLTVLGMLGFYYGNEFAQAVFLLLFPMSLVGLLSVRTSHKIQSLELQGEALYKLLLRHRLATQVIGMISIFVTAIWGMYQNMVTGALG
ncbi:MAG: component of SufBCD complex [Pseudomonadota bacterium]